MYVEVIARQGIEEVQFRCMPSVVSLGDSAASAARIIVVFTTAAEATAAFTLARFLPVSDTRIWLVCPVTRPLLGRLEIERRPSIREEMRTCVAGRYAQTSRRVH